MLMIPPALENRIQQKVQSGHYYSAIEVLDEAINLMDERDALRTLHHQAVHRAVEEGLASGPVVPWDIQEMKEKFNAEWEQARNGISFI